MTYTDETGKEWRWVEAPTVQPSARFLVAYVLTPKGWDAVSKRVPCSAPLCMTLIPEDQSVCRFHMRQQMGTVSAVARPRAA